MHDPALPADLHPQSRHKDRPADFEKIRNGRGTDRRTTGRVWHLPAGDAGSVRTDPAIGVSGVQRADAAHAGRPSDHGIGITGGIQEKRA